MCGIYAISDCPVLSFPDHHDHHVHHYHHDQHDHQDHHDQNVHHYHHWALCRPAGGGPKLDRQALLQFGVSAFWKRIYFLRVHFEREYTFWECNLKGNIFWECVEAGWLLFCLKILQLVFDIVATIQSSQLLHCFPNWISRSILYPFDWIHDTAWESDHFSSVTQGHNWPSWYSMRKWSFFVSNAGSQLTFMTQHEKVIIFRQ